jgi:5,10-methylenetetrahydromethanopterin reductase
VASVGEKCGHLGKKPLKTMRETVEVLRRLLNMERVTFHGEFHHVDGIELNVYI